jgi:alpha-L-rhamnosidase
VGGSFVRLVGLGLWTGVVCLGGAAPVAGQLGPPTGLMIELLGEPEQVLINRQQPRLGWIVSDPRRAARQTAWQVQLERLDGGALVWDSGQVVSSDSVSVPYAGPPLAASTSYRWRVMIWDRDGRESPWSDWQTFHMATQVWSSYQPLVWEGSLGAFINRPGLVEHREPPLRVERLAEGGWFLDFGRSAFGNLEIDWPEPPADVELVVSLGEKLLGPQRLDPEPPGSVRFQRHSVVFDPERRIHTLPLTWTPPGWMKEGYLSLPPELGQVIPFRYAVLERLPDGLDLARVRRRWLATPFDTEAASFRSSRPGVDQIWELCRYTVEATTFLGLYVDGERERKPYEADAFINQLAHYNVDRSYAVARQTHEYLLQRPTWPLEWQPHSVMIAWEDYLHTGDRRSLEACYPRLAVKTLVGLAREDGLIDITRQTPELLEALSLNEPMKTLIDWPPGERDGHKIKSVDAVANAFHYRALVLMQQIAQELGMADEALKWGEWSARVKQRYQEVFFDPVSGLYRDGEGVDHSSLHANLFPLAFDLVPNDLQRPVLDWLESRGMAGSVYAAHYLLEVLFRYGRPQAAIELIDSRELRSWHNMLAQGASMTMEAWDQRFKTNQDWNHPWATGPAAAVGRWLVGVQPLEPGYERIRIAPQPGELEFFEARVPTIRGPVDVRWQQQPQQVLLGIVVPANCTGQLELPVAAGEQLAEGGEPVKTRPGIRWLEPEGGRVRLELEPGRYEFAFPR